MKSVLMRIEILLSQILKSSEIKLIADDHNEIWLDGTEVKNLLHIGDMTLFRRRSDGAFKSKKIGKKWFYARSTLE